MSYNAIDPVLLDQLSSEVAALISGLEQVQARAEGAYGSGAREPRLQVIRSHPADNAVTHLATAVRQLAAASQHWRQIGLEARAKLALLQPEGGFRGLAGSVIAGLVIPDDPMIVAASINAFYADLDRAGADPNDPSSWTIEQRGQFDDLMARLDERSTDPEFCLDLVDTIGAERTNMLAATAAAYDYFLDPAATPVTLMINNQPYLHGGRHGTSIATIIVGAVLQDRLTDAASPALAQLVSAPFDPSNAIARASVFAVEAVDTALPPELLASWAGQLLIESNDHQSLAGAEQRDALTVPDYSSFSDALADPVLGVLARETESALSAAKHFVLLDVQGGEYVDSIHWLLTEDLSEEANHFAGRVFNHGMLTAHLTGTPEEAAKADHRFAWIVEGMANQERNEGWELDVTEEMKPALAEYLVARPDFIYGVYFDPETADSWGLITSNLGLSGMAWHAFSADLSESTRAANLVGMAYTNAVSGLAISAQIAVDRGKDLTDAELDQLERLTRALHAGYLAGAYQEIGDQEDEQSYELATVSTVLDALSVAIGAASGGVGGAVIAAGTVVYGEVITRVTPEEHKDVGATMVLLGGILAAKSPADLVVPIANFTYSLGTGNHLVEREEVIATMPGTIDSLLQEQGVDADIQGAVSGGLTALSADPAAGALSGGECW
jgi:hypothetical protein